MSAAESQLVRWVEPSEAVAASWVVTLHAAGRDPRELLPLCRVGSPASALCAVQAPFSRNAFLCSGQPIVRDDDAIDRHALGDAYGGYSWFRHDPDGRPDPVSFGDSLAQLEALSAELRAPHGDHERTGIYVVGHGEGATLARAAATFFPDLLDGVVAVGGADVAAVLGDAYEAESRGAAAIPLLDVHDVSLGDVRLAATVSRWFEARHAHSLWGRAGAAEESHGIG